MPRASAKGTIHSDGIRELIASNVLFTTTITEVKKGYSVRIILESEKLVLSKHYPSEARIFSTMNAVCSYCRRVGINDFSVTLN